MNHQLTADTMIQKMSAHGLRVTEQRRSLASLFAESQGYLSPKDVYDFMRRTYPGVSFDTVYRNLRLLSDMSVLEQVYFQEGGLKFKANCHEHHHHHMICLQCERTFSIEFCPMEHMKEKPSGFQMTSHRFEIYGYCEACSAE